MPFTLLTVSPEALTNALPNSAMTSSVSDRLVMSTVPLFSSTNVNVTSKLSPLATASLADFARPRSGINSGVGSSDVPMSPSSPAFVPLGSEPLSLSSLTTIGLPSASSPVPPAVTWLSSVPGAPTASGSTSAVN